MYCNAALLLPACICACCVCVCVRLVRPLRREMGARAKETRDSRLEKEGDVCISSHRRFFSRSFWGPCPIPCLSLSPGNADMPSPSYHLYSCRDSQLDIYNLSLAYLFIYSFILFCVFNFISTQVASAISSDVSVLGYFPPLGTPSLFLSGWCHICMSAVTCSPRAFRAFSLPGSFDILALSVFFSVGP